MDEETKTQRHSINFPWSHSGEAKTRTKSLISKLNLPSTNHVNKKKLVESVVVCQ